MLCKQKNAGEIKIFGISFGISKKLPTLPCQTNAVDWHSGNIRNPRATGVGAASPKLLLILF
jgi:hypothetical protein